MLNRNRNFGIDLLRVISMLFIVILHFLGHGGVLAASSTSAIKFSLVYLLETIAYCGVDIFAIISGYVLYSEEKRKTNWSKFIQLWFRVLFYSVGITVILHMFISSKLTYRTLLLSFIPISNNTYWYFTAYFIIFLLSHGLVELSRFAEEGKAYIYLCAGLILLYISHAISGLFSIVLLGYLFFVGALLKKCCDRIVLSNLKASIIIVICVIITWLCKIMFSLCGYEGIGKLLLRYDSPTIIIMAIMLVIIFSRLKLGNRSKSILKFISGSVFSVYLLNDHPDVRENLMSGCLKNVIRYNVIAILFIIICISILFFVIAIAIDKVREALFKIAKIEILSDKIINIFERVSLLCGRIVTKFLFEQKE